MRQVGSRFGLPGAIVLALALGACSRQQETAAAATPAATATASTARATSTGGDSAPARAGIPQDLREPIQQLGLDWPVSMEALKARYKELAKRHHPDANGGDRASEERLKTINIAYAAVRHYLNAEPRMAAAG